MLAVGVHVGAGPEVGISAEAESGVRVAAGNWRGPQPEISKLVAKKQDAMFRFFADICLLRTGAGVGRGGVGSRKNSKPVSRQGFDRLNHQLDNQKMLENAAESHQPALSLSKGPVHP